MSAAGRRPPAAAGSFVHPHYGYRTPDELAHPSGQPQRPHRHPIVIVGAGMVGLTLAADLGQRGIPCVVVDDNDTVAGGSRAIGQARKSLQVWDRSGAAAAMSAKGLPWHAVRYLHGNRVVASAALSAEAGHKFPPMMVLAQYHVESFLVERCQALATVDLRWKNALRGLTRLDDHVRLDIETPEGGYALHADWVVAADGVNSTVRRGLGLPFEGRRIEDRFIIVDVRVDDDFPPGRSFWFRQHFHDGNATLFLRQPEDICRVDFNIGPQADAAQEMRPERLRPKLQAMFGPGKALDIRWVSLYTVEVRRLDRFRHGRVFFAGDAAHQISPFSGGRGGNSGVEDADNLGWKLERVVRGDAPAALLDSYDAERIPIADQNIRYSLRATEFISPSFPVSALFQQAVLTLAETAPFARGLINSGRFSTAAAYAGSPLNSADPDATDFASERTAPGSAAVDAALSGAGRFLVELLGADFCLLVYAPADEELALLRAGLAATGVGLKLLAVAAADAPAPLPVDGWTWAVDIEDQVRQRYGFVPGSGCLFRPDQRVTARWSRLTPAAVAAAWRRACALPAAD